MNKLKLTLTTASAFMFIDYSEETSEIIIEADESENEWEDTLSQVKKKTKKRHSVCYENELWSDIKRKYDVIKQKYHVILKMLKKC